MDVKTDNFKQKNYAKLLALSVGRSAISVFAHAADEQFNDALRAAECSNIDLLQQYQSSMQNDVLGYYPEYWVSE